MPLTTFEEEIYLRVLTGRIVGKAASDLGVNKLAVIAPGNIICSSIAAATEASFIDCSGGVTYHFLVKPGENEAELAEKLVSFNPQTTLLQFGGETPIEDNVKSFVNLMKQIAKRNLPGDIIVHVRIFAAGGLIEAVKDADVKKYLSSRNVFIYTVDFDKGKVILNKIKLNDEIKLVAISEYHLTLEHADLLNRSLKNRGIRFQ
ncbi:MAG: hypothetical protein F7B60_03525 [Desulfurococcales archaeon]|nr:hypothetical protein [Desulfurococcales archaeon]